MNKTVNLKYGTFTFLDEGEDYPFGEWDMGELGIESLAVNPFWARKHPTDALVLSLNGHVLPVDAKLSFNNENISGQQYYVYQLHNHDEDIYYVGQSQNLEVRLSNHMANNYGKEIEYVLATSCETEDAMSLLESTLIAGWEPQLNKALKQYAPGTTCEEANKLAGNFDWNYVWGHGTVFWSTSKICQHMKTEIDCFKLPSAIDDMKDILEQTNKGFTIEEALDYIKTMSFRRAALLMRHNPRWSISLDFMFDAEKYLTFVDEVELIFEELKKNARKY